jgi:hypothetical protein
MNRFQRISAIVLSWIGLWLCCAACGPKSSGYQHGADGGKTDDPDSQICDSKSTRDAKLVSEDIPDGTRFRTGESFRKRWGFLNTGSTAWTGECGYQFIHVSGPALARQEKFDLLQGESIAPGETKDWAMDMRAPNLPGAYQDLYQMAYQGQIFGNQVWVLIEVLPCSGPADCLDPEFPLCSAGQCLVANTDESVLLSVPYHSQLIETDASRWNPSTTCGPTALLMVLDDFQLQNQLSPVVELLDLIDPGQGGYDPACSSTGNPVCTSAAALASVAATHYQLTVDAHDEWSLDQVLDALRSQHPVIADIFLDLTPGKSGHFVVIVGFELSQNGFYLIYHDPYRQASTRVSFEQFVAGWSGPVDVNDPLQVAGHRYWAMAAYPKP